MIKTLLDYLPSINKEGFIFIGIFLLVSLLLFFVSKHLGWLGIILTIWCICFFRDPDRVAPLGSENLIISPADGTIDSIIKATPPKELGLGEIKMTRVSIFLSVFNVHVNRIPVEGKIKELHYHPGKFFSATMDKSSDLNERQSVLIETKDKIEIPLVQIAGLIARRIVCNLDENQEVKAGDRYGIIRFGSRVDVYLPEGIEPLVRLGQTMVGGETIIAQLPTAKPKQTKSTKK
ncbi:MAG: phosphatidylserine decarboxylase [Candidatus Jidaibacter sp.]|jgi:phosphatidylserine decarboxylase|nr:phosphatidylserine decarboxylase [Candidatus Jidaibacter sp.]